MGPSDAELIARVLLKEDHHAFSTLVRRHQSAVRATLRKLTRGDEVLADELAQDTFLNAFRGLSRFRGDAKFTTWLYRIAFNLYQNHCQRTRIHVPLDESDAVLAVGPQREQADLRHDVQVALSNLPESERAAISMCYIAGLTHEEAASALDCPLGTVKTNILRGKEKLQQYLLPWKERKIS